MNKDPKNLRPKRLIHMLIFIAINSILSSPLAAKKAPKKVYKALHSHYYKVRIQAVAMLAKSTDPRAADAIAGMLKDPETMVQVAACDALTAIGKPEHIKLIKALLQSKDDLLRRRARLAIRVLKKKRPQRGTKPQPAKRKAVAAKADSKKVIQLDVAKDRSKSGFDALAKTLQQGLEEAKKTRRAALQAVSKSYLIIPQISTVRPHISDTESRIDVSCHITVVELPQKSLRLSTQVTAAAAQSGRASHADQQELAQDATRAAGEALMNEFVAWALTKK